MRRELTKAERKTLQWYAAHEHISGDGRIIEPDSGWSGRATNWLLLHGFLDRGSKGWHVPSPAGRSALSRSSGEGGE